MRLFHPVASFFLTSGSPTLLWTFNSELPPSSVLLHYFNSLVRLWPSWQCASQRLVRGSGSSFTLIKLSSPCACLWRAHSFNALSLIPFSSSTFSLKSLSVTLHLASFPSRSLLKHMLITRVNTHLLNPSLLCALLPLLALSVIMMVIKCRITQRAKKVTDLPRTQRTLSISPSATGVLFCLCIFCCFYPSSFIHIV